MTRSIVFHSYKGGTGKTTIAANFAALLTKKGYRVFLLDLDVYAPSLQSYFRYEPKKWLNDFLSGDAEIEDVVQDMTYLIDGYNNNTSSLPSNIKKTTGKLWVGFCNSKKEDIYKLEGGSSGSGKQNSTKIQSLRKFILLRESLISNYDADYIIIDTSPGIRYWSINALAVADTLLLTLKMGDLDVDGTKKMYNEIYSSFVNYGAKSSLLLNRVSGYCVPAIITANTATGKITNFSDSFSSSDSIDPLSSQQHDDEHNRVSRSALMQKQEEEESDVISGLCNETKMKVVSAIPCYCDIQFRKREFLTVLEYPNHPYAIEVTKLIEAIETNTTSSP